MEVAQVWSRRRVELVHNHSFSDIQMNYIVRTSFIYSHSTLFHGPVRNLKWDCTVLARRTTTDGRTPTPTTTGVGIKSSKFEIRNIVTHHEAYCDPRLLLIDGAFKERKRKRVAFSLS